MTRRRLVVVGNGMAGARFVEDLVRTGAGDRFAITVFGDEPCGNYNRILLSGVLAGTHRLQDIEINPLSWYRANGVTVHAGTRVERIDREQRTVYGDRGLAEPFDVLVLATGSQPWLPPIHGLVGDDGSLLDGAFVFRSVDDCERMVERARRARTAVVVGGGLLGLEAARGLQSHGLDVTVVHLSPRLMDAQLDEPASQILRRQFEQLGVRVLTGRSTSRIVADAAGGVSAVSFADGTSAPCDMLVVTAGVRPRVQLAEACGLAVHRGIVVDDHLACSSAEEIYAIGECAEHRGQTFGLVAPLWEQAAVLADRLSGRRPEAQYHGSRLTTKLKVAGLDVAVMGEKDPVDDDEVISYNEPSCGIYKKLIVRDDRLVGAILIGDGLVLPTLAHLFTSDGALPVRRAELLFPQLVDEPRRSIEDLPDDAQVCDCNGVTKAQIVECILRGAASAHAVHEQTRAGTGCGSCRPEIERILDMTRRELDANCANLEARLAATAETVDAGPIPAHERS